MRSLMAFLRPKRDDAAPLYTAIVAEARQPAWYLEGQVPDTLEGRFAVLSSHVALTILRLESGDEESVRRSVALMESFIADMDAQMRQEGFGDPSLGKQVRSLVGALAARVDLLRKVREAEADWDDATLFCIYKNEPPAEESAKTFATERLKSFDEHLSGRSDRDVGQGKIG